MATAAPKPMLEEAAKQDPSTANQIIGVLLGVIATMGAVIAKLKSSIRSKAPSDEHLDARIERIMNRRLSDERHSRDIRDLRNQMSSIEQMFSQLVRARTEGRQSEPPKQ